MIEDTNLRRGLFQRMTKFIVSSTTTIYFSYSAYGYNLNFQELLIPNCFDPKSKQSSVHAWPLWVQDFLKDWVVSKQFLSHLFWLFFTLSVSQTLFLRSTYAFTH